MTKTSSPYSVRVNSLTTKFDQRTILRELNFSIKQGEIYALLGGNGAGKSTTLKALLGLVELSSGSAFVFDYDVKTDVYKIRQKVAYLPESVMLYGHLSGLENIRYFLSLSGIQKDDVEIHTALDKVSLQDAMREKRLAHYSKGMRQKTAIALALLRDAPILFLDEPTSGLDPSAIDEFNALISKLSANGATIFMVTHDVYGACQVAHRIGLLHQGRLVGEFQRQDNQAIDTSLVHHAFSEYKTE